LSIEEFERFRDSDQREEAGELKRRGGLSPLFVGGGRLTYLQESMQLERIQLTVKPSQSLAMRFPWNTPCPDFKRPQDG